MSIGENIRRARIEKGITQRELGERLGGISQQQIGQWENGNKNPKLETVHRIANALQVDISEIYTDFAIFKNRVVENSPALSAAKRIGILEDDLFEDLEQRHIIEELDITEDKQELLFEYNKLNTDGQKEARKRVQELTEIPRYTKSDPPK